MMIEPEHLLVITRHKALVDYLREIGVIGVDTPVLIHATVDQVRGRHVIGVLPLHLAAEAALVTEVPMDIPADLRGVELTLPQVRLYARTPVTYQVTKAVGIG